MTEEWRSGENCRRIIQQDGVRYGEQRAGVGLGVCSYGVRKSGGVERQMMWGQA